MSRIEKIWEIAPIDHARVSLLAAELDLPEPLAAILLGRGVESRVQAERFFAPSLADLPSPFLMKGMTEAVAVTLDFMFGELRVKRILMENMHGNEASRRIKTKTGSKFLGVFPFEKPCKGFTHQDRWEMTAEMWQRAKEKGL